MGRPEPSLTPYETPVHEMTVAYVSTPTEQGIAPEVVLTEWGVEQIERLLSAAERIADALEQIAAAPDLLEALKFSVSVHRAQGLYDLSERMAVEKAEAAIAKAEGRPRHGNTEARKDRNRPRPAGN